MFKMDQISLTSKIVQIAGNIVSDMDGEKVMLNIEKGKYFNLGEIGGEIWGLIATPIVVEQIISVLLTEYDISESACEEQVLTFINSLMAEELIQIVDEG